MVGKNEFIEHGNRDLDSSIFLMLNEVIKHVTMPKEWEYMKIKSIYKGKGNNNKRTIKGESL